MSFADMNLMALVMVLSIICVAGVIASEKRIASKDPEIGGWVAGLLIAAWLLGSTFAVHQGWMANYHSMPPPVFLVMFPGLLVVLVAVFSPVGSRLSRGLRFRELIVLQVFRVPLELILISYCLEGRIPKIMTFEGRNFDIVAGVLAAIVAFVQYRGYKKRWIVWAWNCVGFVLLINIVCLAVLSAPGPLRRLNVSPLNSLPFAWPSIWVLFCVLVALGSHLLIFRKLLTPQKKRINLSDSNLESPNS